jgi:hypothetical protein
MNLQAAPAARVQHIAAAIYGTILVLAVVSVLSEDRSAGPGKILAAVLVTAVVFWLAHVYAGVLAGGVAGARADIWRLLAHTARSEWPLVQTALAPAVPLLLGAAGALGRSTAITLALAIGLVDLAGWGYASGRVLGQRPLAAAGSALVAITFGVVLVALKGLLH